MRTDELIRALAEDAGTAPRPLGRTVAAALVPGLLVAVLLYLVLLGPRHDIAAVADTPRFILKFLATGSLAASAFAIIIRLAKPASPVGRRGAMLLVAPVILLAAVVAELFLLPASLWGPSLVGHYWMYCLACIPLLSLGPLVAILYALKNGASPSPARTGAVAGLAAGGLGAAIYATHCVDDSPLFVATWYVLAILFVALVGAVLGRRLLQW